MKRLYFVFVAILSLFIFSCNKINLPTLTATIGNETYKAVYILAIHGPISSTEKGFVIMAGDNPDLTKAKYLAFVVRGDQVGEYDMSTLVSDSVPQVVAIYSPVGQGDSLNKYISTDGFVKITSVDLDKNKVNGEFEFTLKDKDGNILTVKDGKFNNILFVNSDDIMSQLEQFEN